MKSGNEVLKQKKHKIILIIFVLAIVLTSIGFLMARYYIDTGHDLTASHDVYETVVVASDGEGNVYTQEDGVITLTSNGFTSGQTLPLQIDVYYKGASYAAIRLQMMEQWKGRYSMTAGGNITEGILPEVEIPLDLNTDIPMSDNRKGDRYLYFTQYQTTLPSDQVDTDFENQDTLLSTSDGETMYTRNANGTFTRDDENGVWRKYTIVQAGGAHAPTFSDETDSIYNCTVTQLKLYLKSESVQYNRWKQFWNIDRIPDRTNNPPEEESETETE